MSQTLVDPKLFRSRIRKFRIRQIRVSSPEIFQEDPLRLIRIFILSAQAGLTIERATAAGIKKNADLVRQVAPDRLREELFRILEANSAPAVFGAMARAGVLPCIIPQIERMQTIGRGGYHHLHVWPHSLCALARLEEIMDDAGLIAGLSEYLSETVGGGHSRRAVLRLACLLHDVGKPDTLRKESGGRVSYHGHERVGRDIVRQMAYYFNFSVAERHALEDMVMLHLRPGYLANFDRPSERMIFRFLRDAGTEAVSVLLLSLADQRATRGPSTTQKAIEHHESIVRLLLGEIARLREVKPVVPLINGHDLIKELRLKPGPAFADLLRKAEEAQHLGKVTTRVEALGLVRDLVQS